MSSHRHFLDLFVREGWYIVHIGDKMTNEFHAELVESFGPRMQCDDIRQGLPLTNSRWDYPAAAWLAFRDRDDALQFKLSLV